MRSGYITFGTLEQEEVQVGLRLLEEKSDHVITLCHFPTSDSKSVFTDIIQVKKIVCSNACFLSIMLMIV